MDQNWLMAALQSPEGMNFLNSWRQRYGGSGSNAYVIGPSAPVSRWQNPSTGSGGGVSLLGASGETGSFSPAGSHTQVTPETSIGLIRSSFARGGSNDLAGQQQSAASPMMPYWNPGN